MSDQIEIWEKTDDVPPKKKQNPMVAAWGAGPDKMRCKNCIHLKFHQYSDKYNKCRLRRKPNGIEPKHRMSWPACAKFEKSE